MAIRQFIKSTLNNETILAENPAAKPVYKYKNDNIYLLGIS